MQRTGEKAGYREKRQGTGEKAGYRGVLRIHDSKCTESAAKFKIFTVFWR